jgi:hypothetical protein
MNVKQKMSILAASLLPALALAAFFLLGPLRASATSCPGGVVPANPCYIGHVEGCGVGDGGGCVLVGEGGAFYNCPAYPGGPQFGNGEGICESGGKVCCTQ